MTTRQFQAYSVRHNVDATLFKAFWALWKARVFLISASCRLIDESIETVEGHMAFHCLKALV